MWYEMSRVKLELKVFVVHKELSVIRCDTVF